VVNQWLSRGSRGESRGESRVESRVEKYGKDGKEGVKTYCSSIDSRCNQTPQKIQLLSLEQKERE
jgi:hypothetical protein